MNRPNLRFANVAKKAELKSEAIWRRRSRICGGLACVAVEGKKLAMAMDRATHANPPLVWFCPPSKGCQTRDDCDLVQLRLGLPPVQGMPNSSHDRRAIAVGLGLPPVQGMPNYAIGTWTYAVLFGIAPRPRDAKLASSRIAVHGCVWDCPPSKGCQTSRISTVHRRLQFGIAPRPRDAKLAGSAGACAAWFGIAPRPRDAKLADAIVHRSHASFGIAPRPRDAKLLAARRCALDCLGLPPVQGMPNYRQCLHCARDVVWDCPPSKGCQTMRRAAHRRHGVWDCPPSKGCQTSVGSCARMLDWFGIAPRPRDAKLHDCRARFDRLRLGLPPVQGMPNYDRACRASSRCVWDCPPSKGCQTRLTAEVGCGRTMGETISSFGRGASSQIC